MQLTIELLERYKGGQLVSTIEDTGTLQRGQISEIQFLHGVINVKFSWRAENTGTPSKPSDEWKVIEARDFVIETRLYQESLLDDDNRRIPLAECPESELTAKALKPLFLWWASLNMLVIFMPPGDETEIRESDLTGKDKLITPAAPGEYVYAICRARGERGEERLICCLNSWQLPQFDPKQVVLQVKKAIPFSERLALKAELRDRAKERGLTNVVNLLPIDWEKVKNKYNRTQEGAP